MTFLHTVYIVYEILVLVFLPLHIEQGIFWLIYDTAWDKIHTMSSVRMEPEVVYTRVLGAVAAGSMKAKEQLRVAGSST